MDWTALGQCRHLAFSATAFRRQSCRARPPRPTNRPSVGRGRWYDREAGGGSSGWPTAPPRPGTEETDGGRARDERQSPLVRAGAARADLNARTIRRCAPDLIGFQELDAGHRATYAKRLVDYDGVAVDEDAAAVYWRADRFERLGNGTFFLDADPAARVPDWGAEDPLDAT